MNKPSIIIVDDDPDDLSFLLDALTKVGLHQQCKSFYSPTTALEYLKTNTVSPALIISDLNMPEVNGIKFKKLIDESNSIDTIPFIFISTSCRELDELATSGAECLTKPSNIGDYLGIANHIAALINR